MFSQSLHATGSDAREDDEDSTDKEEDEPIFRDFIEPGEQGRINGQEPGEPRVPLTDLKRDNATKSWLFEKYYGMKFLDKNPEGVEAQFSDCEAPRHKHVSMRTCLLQVFEDTALPIWRPYEPGQD